MKYRKLGSTGLDVSCLGYGASPLGGVFGDRHLSDYIKTVHTALDLGINYIDVSPYYGLTKAETVLGKALAGIPRDSYHLATKVGRYGMDEFDFTAERVTRSLDESLQRMGVDYVDVIQCHDIEFTRLDQIVEETLPALRKLQDAGKARFVGITGLPLKIFPYVMDRAEVDTILSYCRFSLNDDRLIELTPYLTSKNCGIITASPLSMGLLSQRGPQDWHPAGQYIRNACRRAADYCREKEYPIEKLAVQFSVRQVDLNTTLVGTARADHIERNVKWIEEELDESLLAEVLTILQPIQGRTWPSGLKENSDV